MLPSRGRPGVALLFDVERELTAGDIMRLATDPTIGRVGPPTIQRLRGRHHAIARLLASGRTITETALATGMTPQRVGDLARTDPAFQELLMHYQKEINELGLDEAAEFQGKLRDIGREALEEIQDRLNDDDTRKKMSVEELRRLSEMAMDRSVAPPKTSQPVINTPTRITFNMGPRKLEPKTIDHKEAVIDVENENG